MAPPPWQVPAAYSSPSQPLSYAVLQAGGIMPQSARFVKSDERGGVSQSCPPGQLENRKEL